MWRCTAGDGGVRAGPSLADDGHHPVSQVVAGEARLFVGGVVHPLQGVTPCVRCEFVARDIEQRARDMSRGKRRDGRHRGQPAYSGAAQQLQERVAAWSSRCCAATSTSPAFSSFTAARGSGRRAPRLRIRFTTLAGNLGFETDEIHPTKARLFCAMPAPRAARRLQAVIDMDQTKRTQLPAGACQRVSEHCGPSPPLNATATRGLGPVSSISVATGSNMSEVDSFASKWGVTPSLVGDFAVDAEAVDARVARGTQLVGRQLLEVARVLHQSRP